MTDRSVTLSIPQHLYDQARRLAERQSVPIEQVLVHQLQSTFVDLPALSPDEQTELEALTHLSDEALWTIAREQMQEMAQQRMQILMERNNFGLLVELERSELKGLVELGQRLMLRKAKAMALLTQRGYTIKTDDLGRA